MGYSFRLAARVLLYAPSHRQDNIPLPLLHQSWSTGWNENYLNEFAMKDRSDDPSHHERTLLPRSYISPLYDKEPHWLMTGMKFRPTIRQQGTLYQWATLRPWSQWFPLFDMIKPISQTLGWWVVLQSPNVDSVVPEWLAISPISAFQMM